MLDKTKRYLIVGLGLLGGKYAMELTKAGFHVDGINRSEGHLQYALDHGYIASGKTHDFDRRKRCVHQAAIGCTASRHSGNAPRNQCCSRYDCGREYLAVQSPT